MSNDINEVLNKFSALTAEELTGMLLPVNQEGIRKLQLDLLEYDKELLQAKSEYDQMIQEQIIAEEEQTEDKKRNR